MQPEPTAVIYSVAERYLGAGTSALRSRFPEAQLDELAPEVGRIALPGLSVADVAAACRGSADVAPVPFVRHLAAEDEVVTAAGLTELPAVAAAHAVRRNADRLSLQVWSSGKIAGQGPAPERVRAPDVRHDVELALADHRIAVTRGGQPTVLTVCLAPSGASLGVTSSDDTLSDWPGGRVVLGRPSEQVSRAEWKLEELFKLQDGASGRLVPGVPRGDDDRPKALDLGASPGGWTRILRRRGFDVWAVDPGELHPTVAADAGVHHVRTTAGRFLAETELGFDLVVNDMRMAAEQSARVMVEAASRLRPDGLVVVTLKVSPKRPMATVERCLAILGAAYTPVMVRQLYHNRNEVTVLARRQ